MEIPWALIEQIKDGNVVLFLGAGASHGAMHPKGINIPQGQELSNLIAEKFLGKMYLNKPLQFIAELAISESDLFKVQNFIADLVSDFEPAPFHCKLPTFIWKAIASTNYDLIIEKSYNSCRTRAQDLAPCKKNGESIESKLSSRRNLLYLKLHGCITETNDSDLPLILTPDQYITHRQGRSRLFDRVKEYAYEYPFVFIGHSLADYDIRAILLELLQLKDARPRSYIVGPNINEPEARLWESKKISSIPISFEEFISKIDSCINSTFRILRSFTPTYEHPIKYRFKTKTDIKLSNNFLNFIDTDVDYLHKSFVTKDSDPKAFYKGFFPDWDPILKEFDVKRFQADYVLSEVFLVSEEDKDTLQELYVIKGHAGSGKTVFLKRLAWDAAVLFDKLCLFAKPQVVLNYNSIAELFNLCKERIFLFIDPVSDNLDAIINLLDKSKQDKIPLTIFSAERDNEWNICCVPLENKVTREYSIRYLNDNEIESLLFRLDKFHSLGYLQGLSLDKQIHSLSKLAGRELLVALHEATLGKPFSEIILDEYNSISSSEAQNLYLTVSILHRLGVGARAGLISRVHGINFTRFKEKLFLPLEYVVFARKNDRINDFIYQTRHPHIADMVFEQVLLNAQDRFDEFVRVMSCLDLDYQSDFIAFKGMTNARNLMAIFSDPLMIRQLYRIAESRSINNPFLMQQMAIFEMASPSGNLSKATELLNQAHLKAPWNKQLAHSLSELSFKKSEKASIPAEKIRYLKDAQLLASQLASQNPDSAHAYHTLIKINLSKLSDAIHQEDESSIEGIIKDTEKILTSSKQAFPNDSILLEAESSFCNLINDEPRAFSCLQTAFGLNKRSPFIALRLASIYVHKNNTAQAINILKESLELNPNDKELNFKISMLLLETKNNNLQEIGHYLRRSFTLGDNRHFAQFWYARNLYLMNEIEESIKIFKTLRTLNVDIKLKRDPIGFVCDQNDKKCIFSGTITKIELSYAFIRRDKTSDLIFAYRYNQDSADWDELRFGTRLSFNLAFTYKGPVGVNFSII